MNKKAADVIANIKQGYIGRQTVVGCKFSRVSFDILKCLARAGLILGGGLDKSNKQKIKIGLKYYNNRPAFRYINLQSKKSNKKFLSHKELLHLRMREPLTTYILSTTRGFLTSSDAINYRLGGEVLCSLR